MSLIRSRGNRDTELRLITIMRAHGISGWRRHWSLFGKPDFVFPRLKLAVFVDGCFWHGCPLHATSPKTNAAFWCKNEARQRVDGHDVGVAPQRSAGVAVGGRPLGANSHKFPPTAPATARTLANRHGQAHIVVPVTPCYHQTIDARLRRLVEVSIQKIDANPALVARLAQNVARWPNPRLQAQWQQRLRQPWPELRAELLAETEHGAALRQDAPLGGILSEAERTRIMREFAHDARPA
jgi:DNA mismatch endonuclease Vsr